MPIDNKVRVGVWRRVVGASISDAAFIAKSGKLAISGIAFFVAIYMPLLINNVFRSAAIQHAPPQVIIAVLDPLLFIDNVMTGLLIAVIVTSVVDTEKSEHILEYLFAYSPYDVRTFLLMKALSTTLVALPLVILYMIGVCVVLAQHHVLDPLLVASGFASAVILTIAETLVLLLLTLVLPPRYSAAVRFAFIMAVFIGMAQLLRIISSSRIRIGVPLAASYILAALLLGAAGLIYALYSDRIIEKAVG